MTDRVVVSVEIAGAPVRAGELFAHRHGTSESATFRYGADYVTRPDAYELDPALPLTTAPAHTPVGHALFGCFADSAPDRWGRLLATRAERHRADVAGETPRQLSELDILLGVRDDLRQGAVRLATSEGRWLADPVGGLPYLVDLPELLGASDAVDRDDPAAEQLRTLLRAGSSLGGARPKANVIDQDGTIAIAKFPRSRDFDAWDVVRWEAVTLELARQAQIRTARSRLVPVGDRGVLLLRRFDRHAEQRVGYVSAMTMLESHDGDRGTYLEIAEVIEERGSSPEADLRQLWRRLVFGVLVRNTDDHLRNHGFLHDDARSGWRLAPAFDVNPNPEPGNTTLSTSIDASTDEARLDVALEVAPLFRLSRDAAVATVAEVASVLAGWRRVAERHGCTPAEIQRLATAFEHRETEVALAVRLSLSRCRNGACGPGAHTGPRAVQLSPLVPSAAHTCAPRPPTCSNRGRMQDREPQYDPDEGVELEIPRPHPEGAPQGKTRSGFVALAGRPNVGKSTLVNAIVGRKVAIVSDKPQTTRRAIRGVCTGEDFQLVLVDLPGVQRPRDTLTERMQHRVEAELRDCDTAFFLVNAEEGIGPGDRWIAEALKAAGTKVIIVVNKIDRLNSGELIKMLDETNSLGLEAEVFPISARYGDRIEPLVDHMVSLLPEGPFYFDSAEATDQRLELQLAELVREQVLRRTFQEVPHSVEVEVSEIERREDGLLVVVGNIWVETDSQQGILIGSGGAMIKNIGQAARAEIEHELEEEHVHLDLKVRVRKNWRREDRLLDRLDIL